MEEARIGGNIRILRENAGYNQESIAAFLDVDQSLISKIEKGERTMSADMLDKIATLFGVTTASILNDDVVVRSLSCAFRCSNMTISEMEAVSAINRIALNCEFMEKLLSEGKS